MIDENIGRRIAVLERRMATLTRSPKLVNASIEDTAVQVYDGTGTLRGIIGQQPDGTTALTATNGPVPPIPSAPDVVAVLGGISAAWDGTFTDALAAPLDFGRVEVHASVTSGFTPDATTLQGTLESPQGSTLTIPCEAGVTLYVVLLSRSTSGVASPPSVQAGPVGPSPVVADDVLDGIITTVKLANDAVTTAKIAVGAIDSAAIAAGAVTATALGSGAVTAAALAVAAVTASALGTAAVTSAALAAGAVTAPAIAASAVTTAALNAGAVTAGKLAANSVTATAVAAGAITAGAIAAGAVTAGTIAAGVVDATSIGAGAVTAGKIAANAVTATTIAAGAVQAGAIAANAVTAGTIAANAVTSTTIAAGAVTTGALAANSVTATALAAGSVTATALAAGSVVAGKIHASAIDGMTITGGTLIGGLIETSASGARITLDGTTDLFTVYDSSGTAVSQIGGVDGSITNFSSGEWTQLFNGSVYWGYGTPDDYNTGGIYDGYGPGLLGIGGGATNAGLLWSSHTSPTYWAGGEVTLNSGTDSAGLPGTTVNPYMGLGLNSGVVDVLVTGAATFAKLGNPLVRETWQTPTFATNWQTSTVFGTLTGLQGLRYRRGVQDDLIIGGCFSAKATAPGTAVFTLPSGYVPKQAYPLVLTKITGGVTTTALCYISTAGNINLNSQLGSSVTASAQYIIPPQSIPLGNMA